MSNLIPFQGRFLDEPRISRLPVDSFFHYDPLPCIMPETNEFDVDIAQSTNQANIELAKIFEKVNRVNLQAQIIQTIEIARAQTYQCAVNGFFSDLPFLEKKSTHTLKIRDGKIPLFGSKPRIGFMIEVD